MQGNCIHESFNQNCEFHDPRERGSGPRAGPIYPYSKNVIDLRNSISLRPYMFV